MGVASGEGSSFKLPAGGAPLTRYDLAGSAVTEAAEAKGRLPNMIARTGNMPSRTLIPLALGFEAPALIHPCVTLAW